jgi:hypothetical protein
MIEFEPTGNASRPSEPGALGLAPSSVISLGGVR